MVELWHDASPKVIAETTNLLLEFPEVMFRSQKRYMGFKSLVLFFEALQQEERREGEGKEGEADARTV